MSVYRLDNYVLVCEINAFTGSGGCRAELVIEQARGLKDMAERAQVAGWDVQAPGPWDEQREYFALCPRCAEKHYQQIAIWQAKREGRSQ